MNLKILYEDDDILGVDKPAGMSVDEVALGHPEYFLAHRLDKETSGVLILAKNTETLESLKNQFQKRKVKKVYVAIVEGHVKKDYGVVDKPIGRTRSDPRKRLAGRGVVGKERDAVTEYKVLKRLRLPIDPDKRGINTDISDNQKIISGIGSFTLLEVKPKTGRTHQIRVHMKYLNHPVVGDPLYNPKGLPLPSLPLSKGEEKGGGRMMLHAKSIEFRTSVGKILKIESPVPEEIIKVIQ